MIIKWLVNYLRREYGIYPIHELQTWGIVAFVVRL